MNPFEVPSSQPEKDKPKNRLNELSGLQSSELSQRIIESIPKSLPEEMREKRAQKIIHYFDILRQLRERCEKKWIESNIPKNQEQLTDAQANAMQKYTDSVETKKLDDMLVQWRAEWEEAATTMKDEKEKQDLYLQIDALDELQGDMANW